MYLASFLGALFALAGAAIQTFCQSMQLRDVQSIDDSS